MLCTLLGCHEAPESQVTVKHLQPSWATWLMVLLYFSASLNLRAPHRGPRRGTGLPSSSGKVTWARSWGAV